MKNIVSFPDAAVVKKEAAHWIARLDGDEELSPVERESLRKWIHTSPAHHQALYDAAELWGNLNILTELAPQSTDNKTSGSATANSTETASESNEL